MENDEPVAEIGSWWFWRQGALKCLSHNSPPEIAGIATLIHIGNLEQLSFKIKYNYIFHN